ncbi:MAG: GTP-binding protein [Candidatus Lokiarchaeota archaeon]|nr:GTP-binding protein [Candidatus Lokiarchaeota archaeon]MBD3198519.1 GTP-binding protein [Candidatus Lokiarchaeota archaeon]
MSFRGKSLMLGDASVGKTSLLARYIDDTFQDTYQATIGANFLIKEVDLKKIIDGLDIRKELKSDIKKKGFKLYWWDIGGQKDKLLSNEYYFQQSIGAMVVFDIVNRESFDNIEFWISKLQELSGKVPFILVGNKLDQAENRAITKQEAQEKADEYGVKYIETSAKKDQNVDNAFEMLAILILNTFTD